MIGTLGVLTIIGLGLVIISADQRVVATRQKIKELIADLDSAIAGLNERIAGVETTRALDVTQADQDLEIERTRILAEEKELIEADDAYDSRLEREIRQRLDAHEIDQAEYDRQIADLEVNRVAALAEVTRKQGQATVSRDLTIANIAERIAAGDIEAQRQVDQIVENRDAFLARTKDEAVLALNAAGPQVEYTTGRALADAAMERGQAVARIAGSAVLRSGSPLLALRQIEKDAKEKAAAEGREARYGIQRTEMGAKQTVVEAREKATDSTEDIMAQNAMQDMELEQQREKAELDFLQTYADLEASRDTVNRQAQQDAATLRAQQDAEDTDYLADIEDLRADARIAKDGLDATLAAAITQTTQVKESINTAADLLTQEYRRNLGDAARHRKNLKENSFSILVAAAVGGVSDILKTAGTFLGTLPAVG